MKRAWVSLVIVALLSCSGKRCLAEEPLSFNLEADIGYLSGYTLYHITIPINESVDGYFVINGESELEFPIDSAIGRIIASLGKKDLWSIDLSLSRNITGETGKTKDTDLLTVRDEGRGEIKRGWIFYSESDTEMNALLVDLNGRYYFLKRGLISLGGILGYRYQRLSFDISNVDQLDALGDRIFIPGKALTYEITYDIPYGGLALEIMPSRRFSLHLLGTYGRASADDEDDHILRSKRATADADGPFYSFHARGEISLTQRLSLIAFLEYLKIDTDGTQTQTWYATTEEAPAGTTITGINYSAETEQLYLLAGIRYLF